MKPNIFLLIGLLTFYVSSFAQESPKPSPTQTTDTPSRPFQYYFAVRPIVAVTSFGSKDFRQSLENITEESIADVQWGVQIQFGVYTHKRWSLGAEFNILRATNTIYYKYPSYVCNSLYGGLYGMYDIVQRPNFILSGKIALGFGYSS